MLDKHDTVFELGKMKGINAHLNLKENAQPKFLKARSVAFALRPRIESELDCLQEQGVISPVKHSDWATPIVPALKKNGSVRICGDYRVTVNPAINAEQYPLPKVTDIFANLSGGQKFSKIDLTQAYHQMELDDESKKLLVINTHKGQGRQSYDFGAVIGPHSQWQKVSFFPNLPLKIPKIVQSEKSRLSVCY